MALVTDRVVSLLGGQVWLEVTYDDTTLVMSQVETWNGTGAPVGRVWIYNAKGTVVDQAIPAGSTVVNISGRRLVTDYNLYATA